MIASRNNETLKAIRRLRRRQGEEAVLDGPHLLAAALDAGLSLQSVLVSPAFRADPARAALLARLSRPPLEVEAELLASVADADSPRGCLAVVRLPRGGAATLPTPVQGIHLYLDGVQDPGNLGALARVAEALGARSLVLAPGCAHPNHPRALRGSAGSLLRLPVAVSTTPDQFDAQCGQTRRPLWIALAAHGGQSAPELPDGRPVVLAAGAEGPGLSAAVMARADAIWTLPLAAPVESLNVAVATAIALWELNRRTDPGGTATISG